MLNHSVWLNDVADELTYLCFTDIASQCKFTETTYSDLQSEFAKKEKLVIPTKT